MATTPSRIVDYDTLKNAIGRWLEIESNPQLVNEIPQFVQLAENRINRLKIRIMERTSEPLPLSEGDRILPLPTDFNGAQYINLYAGVWPNGTLEGVLFDISRPNVKLVQDLTKPGFNRIEGNELHLFPAAPAGDHYLIMGYWRKVPPLGGDVGPGDKTLYAKDVSEGGYAVDGKYTRNWLLDENQDLYLYASLVHGEGYIPAELGSKVPVWENNIVNIISQTRKQDKESRRGGTGKAPLLAGGTP